MKIILSIIFMFLSAQSFAGLNGKALFCRVSKSSDSFFEGGPYGVFAYLFKESTYEHFVINRKNDNIMIAEHFQNKSKDNIYRTDPKYIYIKWNSIYKNYNVEIDRKTLYLHHGVYLPHTAECYAYNDFQGAIDMMRVYQNVIQKEYNRKLKGNKM